MTFFGRYTINPLTVNNIYPLADYDWKCLLSDLNKNGQEY